ncbi:polyketide synthase [Priestia megaterium]|uniref:polyketide synthase n=1 Tax=Priestia megaterium TaxID=1404 RepID=UPI0012D8940C|nr:polyketide synthase [Priestia megaterium]MUL34710.1 putative polyketide biosynthesis enoyl-CoA isomerase PksI [Priestia megaterium]
MKNSAVTFKEVESCIVQVTMQDRVHKNTFSKELVQGLIEAFQMIKANSTYKVVILTGYDNYFCSGGTQEGLLAIHEGRGKFTDVNVYALALECEIPVIAAMQGHGIGGGFVMGLFADFVILGRESVYTTNFMKFGFTPGMGATYIVPKKMGFSLGEEMLLSAGNYRGAELEKRGVPFKILPRKDVLSSALQLARQVAEKPRVSLITLKNHMVESIREQLSKVVSQEVAMHEKTFHEPEVKERIVKLFRK